MDDSTTPRWIPLVIAHIVTLVLDKTAQIAHRDAIVPFQVQYGWWQIGLGTLAFDILIVVTVTSWLRKYMNNTLWQWIHSTSYIALAAIFFQAFFTGTAFGDPLVSAIAWSSAHAPV